MSIRVLSKRDIISNQAICPGTRPAEQRQLNLVEGNRLFFGLEIEEAVLWHVSANRILEGAAMGQRPEQTLIPESLHFRPVGCFLWVQCLDSVHERHISTPPTKLSSPGSKVF